MDALENEKFEYADGGDMSANQMYKRSGSTLSFKDWLEGAKQVGVFDSGLTLRERFERIFSKPELWNMENQEGDVPGPTKNLGLFGMPPLLTAGVAITTIFLVAYGIRSLVRGK